MSDYIKKEDAMAAVDKCRYDTFQQLNGMKGYLNAIPPADVAKVVRCKDCKYRKDDNGNCYVSNFIVGLPCMIRYVGEDGYCSYGKHKGARA